MNQLLESVTKDIDAQIEKLQAIKEDLPRWLPNLPYDGTAYYTRYSSTINVELPFDRNLMEQVKTTLKAQEFTCWERDEQSTTQLFGEGAQNFTPKVSQKQYHYPEVSLSVEYKPYKDGSVCVRRKIGERTETRPVYEFVCKEALIEEEKAASQEV